MAKEGDVQPKLIGTLSSELDDPDPDGTLRGFDFRWKPDATKDNIDILENLLLYLSQYMGHLELFVLLILFVVLSLYFQKQMGYKVQKVVILVVDSRVRVFLRFLLSEVVERFSIDNNIVYHTQNSTKYRKGVDLP